MFRLGRETHRRGISAEAEAGLVSAGVWLSPCDLGPNSYLPAVCPELTAQPCQVLSMHYVSWPHRRGRHCSGSLFTQGERELLGRDAFAQSHTGRIRVHRSHDPAGTPSKVQRCTPSSLSSPQPGGELIQRRLRAASRRDTKGLGEENPDHTYPGAVSGKGMVKFPLLCAVHSRCLIDVY